MLKIINKYIATIKEGYHNPTITVLLYETEDNKFYIVEGTMSEVREIDKEHIIKN